MVKEHKLKLYQEIFCYAYMRTLRPSEYIFHKYEITWNSVKRSLMKNQNVSFKENTACFRLCDTFYRNLLLFSQNVDRIPIEYLLLSTEINNILRRNSICFIDELNDYDLYNLRKVGIRYRTCIRSALDKTNFIKIEEINKKILSKEKVELKRSMEYEWWNQLIIGDSSKIMYLLSLLYEQI